MLKSVLSDENNTIERCVKEAIAIKQRKLSLSRDEGMDLLAIYNPLLGRTWVTTLMLCNLTFYISDEVRAIWTKYSILNLNCK